MTLIDCLNNAARENVKKELKALNRKRVDLNNIIKRVAELSVPQLEGIKKKIDELHPQA